MVITPHMLIGAGIGAHSPNLWLAFAFGLLSHYLIDALPHWDYLKEIRINNFKHLMFGVLDTFLGLLIVIGFCFFSSEKTFLFVGALAAVLPDFLEFIYYNWLRGKNVKWIKSLSIFHHKIHFPGELNFWQGLPFLLGVIAIAVWLILGA